MTQTFMSAVILAGLKEFLARTGLTTLARTGRRYVGGLVIAWLRGR
jgi:hypothetical protein